MDIKTMTMEEVEARAAEIREALNAEDADLEALNAEAEELSERRTALIEERKAAIEAVANGAGELLDKRAKETSEMTNVEIRNTKAYIDAYAEYVKTGDDTECRSLLTENVEDGVIPVPTIVAGIVAERIKASRIIDRCRKMYAKGNVKVGFEIEAPLAEVHTEGGEAVTEEELSLGIVTMVPATLKKWISVSDEALAMDGGEFLAYIYDEVTRGIIRKLEALVIAAILNAPTTATAEAPAVATVEEEVGPANFVNMRAAVSSAASNLVAIVSPSDYAAYKAAVMGAGYAVDIFDGMEVIISDYATAPIVGDLSGIMINFPEGENVKFKFDDKTLMTSDLVRILGRLMVAPYLVGNKYFAVLDATGGDDDEEPGD